MEAEAKIMFEQFNRREFKTSEKIEQIAEVTAQNAPMIKSALDTVGAELHLGAMLGSGKGIDKLPSEHMKIVHYEE